MNEVTMKRENPTTDTGGNKHKVKNPFISYIVGGMLVILLGCMAFSTLFYKTNMVMTVADATSAVNNSSFYKQISVQTIKKQIEQEPSPDGTTSGTGGNANKAPVVTNIEVTGLAKEFLDSGAADSKNKAAAMAKAYELVSKKYNSAVGIGAAANIRGEGTPGQVQYLSAGFAGWESSANVPYGAPVYVSDQSHVNAIISTCDTLGDKNHTGVGICQWTWYTRLKKLAVDYYQPLGANISDYESLCGAEVNFILEELAEKNYAWLTSDDYNYVTQCWCIQYENPSNAGAHAVERQGFARQIVSALNSYNGS